MTEKTNPPPTNPSPGKGLMQRRKFLKTAWGGAVIFGSGLIGFPFGACSSDGSKPTPKDLQDLDLDALPEMNDQEIADFIDQVDLAAADVITPPEDVMDLSDSEVSSPDAQDLTDQSDAPEISDEMSEADVEKPRLPPGQHLLEVMPVLGSNADPRTLEEWRFTVTGEVENPLDLSWDEFNEMFPMTDIVCDVHCVTTWTVFDTERRGVLLSDIYAVVNPTNKAKFVIFESENGYSSNMDIEETWKPNVMINTQLFGEPLPKKYGGPARALIPDRYYYKSAKWITGIRLVEIDEPGFWETRGYSNTAYPWEEDRYS